MGSGTPLLTTNPPPTVPRDTAIDELASNKVEVLSMFFHPLAVSASTTLEPTSKGPILIRFTQHGLAELEKRKLASAWVEAVILRPDRTTSDPSDPVLTRSYKTILEAGNRVLRVVHRPEGADVLVITAFFDRNAKP